MDGTVDFISDVVFLLQTCQPPKKENLETYEKQLGDSTKSTEIPFFFPNKIKQTLFPFGE